jgi:hypothetical protein
MTYDPFKVADAIERLIVALSSVALSSLERKEARQHLVSALEDFARGVLKEAARQTPRVRRKEAKS